MPPTIGAVVEVEVVALEVADVVAVVDVAVVEVAVADVAVLDVAEVLDVVDTELAVLLDGAAGSLADEHAVSPAVVSASPATTRT